jgi:hypothetical protein
MPFNPELPQGDPMDSLFPKATTGDGSESNHARVPHGAGHEADRMNIVRDLPENSDVRVFNVETHVYAVAIRGSIGPFTYLSLKALVKKLAVEHSVNVTRDTTRSMPLLVKWLYQHRDWLPGMELNGGVNDPGMFTGIDETENEFYPYDDGFS